jgi:hypothetical protein
MGQDTPDNNTTNDNHTVVPPAGGLNVGIAHSNTQDDVDCAEQFETSLHFSAAYVTLGTLCYIHVDEPRAPCHVLLEACDDRDAAANTTLDAAGCAALDEEGGAELVDEVRLLQRQSQKAAMISALEIMLADASDIFGVTSE